MPADELPAAPAAFDDDDELLVSALMLVVALLVVVLVGDARRTVAPRGLPSSGPENCGRVVERRVAHRPV